MKLLVLDRDGVVNQDSKHFVKSPAEWHALPGSLEAIGRLCEAGWTVTVASNQSGVGRRLFDLGTLHDIQSKFESELADQGGRIDGFFYCPHAPRSNCDCRKPKPGLLVQIGQRFQVGLEGVPVVGDSLRDLEAAWAVGARAILVLTGNGVKTRDQLPADSEVEIYDDLAGLAQTLMDESSRD